MRDKRPSDDSVEIIVTATSFLWTMVFLIAKLMILVISWGVGEMQ